MYGNGLKKRDEPDTDTLDMADMLLGYLLPRCVVREKREGKRCAVHNTATYRALQLLNVQRRKDGWFLRDTWKKRLELAGIDPLSMEVVEPRRWARAWLWLSTQWRFKEEDAIRGNALDSDAPWPPEPIKRGLKHHPLKDKRAGNARPAGRNVLREPGELASPQTILSRFRTRIEADEND